MPSTLRSPIQDAGDVASGAVRILEIPKSDAIFGFELIERALVGKILAFAVCDGQVQNLVLRRASK